MSINTKVTVHPSYSAHRHIMNTATPLCSFLSFLCLRYEVAGGIMFSGCPSVRTSVRNVPFSWSRYLKNRLMDSCQTLVMYVSCRADELIIFWVTRSKVKGHRAHYVCKNPSYSAHRHIMNTATPLCSFWFVKLLSFFYTAGEGSIALFRTDKFLMDI